MLRLLSPLAICLALGACATYSQPGTAPTAFDGTYQGTVTLTHAAMNAPCSGPGSKDASLTVQNGSVVWASGGTNLYAPVQKDGAFAAQNGAVYFSGKITNRAMVARSNTGSCHTVYDLLKAA